MIVGLGLLYVAVFIANPTLFAPSIIFYVYSVTPTMIRLLFVTIVCVAISDFHGLVSSGTTSKQLNKESDARFVGYFGAVGEGSLALAAIIAASAGFATLADWQALYHSFGEGGVNAFVQGGAAIIQSGIGI